MFKKLTTTALLMILLTSLAACGGKTKKKKVDNLGAIGDQVRDANNDNDTETRKPTFLEEELEGIRGRMDDAIFFEITRQGIGRHQIIYFPAIQDSRNSADHEERWYFRNPTMGFADNVAFRIYPKAGQESAATFQFELSPLAEVQNLELTQISSLTLEPADTDNKARVLIQCGNVDEVYEAATYAGNVGIAYYPLNESDESYDHFHSPCGIYSQEQLERGLLLDANAENNTQLAVEPNQEDEECIDQATEELAPCEEKEVKEVKEVGTTCDESRFMRFHVKIICHHKSKSSECSQSITPVGIMTQSSAEMSCQSTCTENTCASSTNSDVNQTEASNNDRMATAGELTDLELLPYCTSQDQRTYMRRSEKVQKVEERISALVDYCAFRPELGKHCEAAKMHDLHKKIDRKKKDQAKIISRCISRRDANAASGDYSNPEMNTCGFITRGILTSHRNNLNSYQAKLAHLQATCKSGGKCNSKKEEKLASKISHRQHKIEKLEKKCNVK